MELPPNGWFIRKNPIKMDDFGGTPIYGNPHMVLIQSPCGLLEVPLSHETGQRFQQRTALNRRFTNASWCVSTSCHVHSLVVVAPTCGHERMMTQFVYKCHICHERTERAWCCIVCPNTDDSGLPHLLNHSCHKKSDLKRDAAERFIGTIAAKIPCCLDRPSMDVNGMIVFTSWWCRWSDA